MHSSLKTVDAVPNIIYTFEKNMFEKRTKTRLFKWIWIERLQKIKLSICDFNHDEDNTNSLVLVVNKTHTPISNEMRRYEFDKLVSESKQQ